CGLTPRPSLLLLQCSFCSFVYIDSYFLKNFRLYRYDEWVSEFKTTILLPAFRANRTSGEPASLISLSQPSQCHFVGRPNVGRVYSRSHDAVIRVYDAPGKAGEFKEWCSSVSITTCLLPFRLISLSPCRLIRHNSRHACFYPLCSSRAH